VSNLKDVLFTRPVSGPGSYASIRAFPTPYGPPMEPLRTQSTIILSKSSPVAPQRKLSSTNPALFHEYPFQPTMTRAHLAPFYPASPNISPQLQSRSLSAEAAPFTYRYELLPYAESTPNVSSSSMFKPEDLSDTQNPSKLEVWQSSDDFQNDSVSPTPVPL
jgi:hypothetical protein